MSVTRVLEVVVDPYRYAVENFKESVSCRVAEAASAAIHVETQDTAADLLNRVARFAIGLILIVPLVNIVALHIFKLMQINYVDDSVVAGNYWFGLMTSSPTEDEEYLELINRGDVLLPQEPEPQAPVGPEVYQQRKQQAIDALRPPVPPELGDVRHFKCADEIMDFNLDNILVRFDAGGDPARLSEFFDYAGVGYAKRWELEGYFRNYEGEQTRQVLVRQYLSKLYDFLNQKKALFEGHARENLFKAEIRYIFDKIIDAHHNCIDQVLSQVEGIMLEVVASFETAHIRGGLTREQAIAHQAAYFLFRHKLDLVKTICVKEYPNEPHMADLERAAKQKLADILGLRGEIIEAGAHYNIINDMDMKASNVAHILLEGRPLEEYRGARVNLARAGRRYAEDQFKPEKFFSDGLKTYHGEPRNLRNNILLWVRKYFDLETANDQTAQFVRAISEDEAFGADEGGDLNTPALLRFLTTLRIFERRLVPVQ